MLPFGHLILRSLLAGLILLTIKGQALGQQFRLLRFDEDYRYLRQDSSHQRFRPLKFIPLNHAKSWYATLGGEIRYEYAFKKDEEWLEGGGGSTGSLLQRYVLLADIHAGDRFRFFVQGNSALEGGSKFGAAPVDEDRLNVQNLFAEYRLGQPGQLEWLFRLGRQELNYGSGRLISVREGTNVRLYFTGAKVAYRTPRFGIDGLVMMADSVRQGVLDNTPTRKINLWGTYAYLIIPKGGNFDFYYLGFYRPDREFEEGIANETRHTIATRYWKYGGGFIYNLEAAYQFGSFGKGNISAWTAAVDIGYRFENIRFKPSINLRNDYISGDQKRGDGTLQTFNPLYPKGGYFGFNPRIGPVNLIDLHPYVVLSLNEKAAIQADVVFSWRYSLQDGVYRPSGSFNLAGSSSRQRYIGTAYLLSLDYEFSPYFKLSGGGQYFVPGGFLDAVTQSPPASRFLNLQLTFKF